MSTVIRASKRLIPVEQIALFEPFIPPSDPTTFASTKDFRGRIVMLDKMSVLTEETPEDLAAANGFRMIVTDRIATNPAVQFNVETFSPAENFQPTKPFLSRLIWRDGEGNSQSRLLLASPELVLAIAIRGEIETGSAMEERAAPPSIGRRRATRRRRAAPSANAG